MPAFLEPCRYLEVVGDRFACAYYDDTIQQRESARCWSAFAGTWDCYEEDSEGCIFHDGRWFTLTEFLTTTGGTR